jgi:putative transposase
MPGEVAASYATMYAFIEAERDTYGVEPICEVLAIAPSGYRAYRARHQDPS